MNYVDTIIGKVISWVDAGFAFIMQYSQLFVWGFVAIMVSKFMKVNLKLGNRK